MVDMLFKEPGQRFVLRCQVALAHDPPGPLSFRIKDQQVPAAIIPADLRACQVNGTVSFRGYLIVPEKRTGFGTVKENGLVIEEGDLVRVNRHHCLFTCILVVYEKPVIPVVFPDGMDKPEMAAAFPALAAFKRHSCHSDRIPGIVLLHLNFTAQDMAISGKMMPDGFCSLPAPPARTKY
jgi:hypothetical protein